MQHQYIFPTIEAILATSAFSICRWCRIVSCILCKRLAFYYFCGHVYVICTIQKLRHFFLFLLSWNAHAMFCIVVRNWRLTPPCCVGYYSWFYAFHFRDKLSFSLTGILVKKLFRLWFSGVYCLQGKMQKAQSFLTAIFGYVWCSDREPMLFYTDRTTFVYHVHKTDGSSSKSRVVCIIATASVHSDLFHIHTKCFGMCLVSSIQCRLLDLDRKSVV